MKNTRLVIGLTGGIGSGKSTVADLFAQKGIAIIDTDQIAREVTQPNSEALNAIVKKFGEAILSKDGTLNRALLRQKIFEHPSDRLFLEKLLHPLIRTEMQKKAASATSPYCIAVIPLLFETEPNPLIDRILVVDTPEEIQIARTIARDHLSEDAVHAILKSQVSRKKRLQGADDVIINNGNIETLKPQVEKLHKEYLKMH